MGDFDSNGMLRRHGIKCEWCGVELLLTTYDFSVEQQSIDIRVVCHHCGTELRVKYAEPRMEISQKYKGVQCVDCKSRNVSSRWSDEVEPGTLARCFTCILCGCRWEERYILTETVMHTKGHEQ